MAEYHRETADRKIQGKLTPTARVGEFIRRIDEANNKITDLNEGLQQTNNFLSSHSHYLIGGQ